MDCFPIENHRQFEVKAIEVNFINEALPGDTITLFRDVSESRENKIYIEGQKGNSGNTVFKATVEISER